MNAPSEPMLSRLFTLDLFGSDLIVLAFLSIIIALCYRQFSKKIYDNEKRLKIATASSRIGIWEYDLLTRELIWDETMCRLYQLNQTEFNNSLAIWLSRLHPEDKAATELAFTNAIAGIQDYKTVFRVILQNGAIGYIKSNAHLIKDKHQKAVRLIGTDWDNSDQIHIQQKLNFAFAGINNSRNAFFWMNHAGQIIDINECACQSLGYTREELVGQYKWFINPNFSADSWSEHWLDIKQKLTNTFESTHHRKDKSSFPVELTASILTVDEKEYCFYYSHDITRRKSNEERIKQLAFFDPLTELPNRRLLQDRLIQAIERARRDNLKLALLIFDLDRFKAVNDSLGHRMGDELLQQVASRIKNILRKTDTIARLDSLIARLGGDEFVVLLENIASPENAAVVSNKIIAELKKAFKLGQNDDVQIGVSIGISLYPQHGDDVEMLLDRADTALYRAKEQGRGCFAYYSEDLTLAARNRLAIENRLRRAIEQQELRVYYQPQVDINSGRIIGAEALVRWQDPNEGLIPPIQFIPIAEESNLIVDIGEFVLRETCRQGRQWLDMGLSSFSLAVNVSPQQFRRSDIVALVTLVLTENRFPAENLEIEITETGLMLNKDNAKNILNQLHHQGIRLAIDDFGTGYSSLAHLKHFPLDVLKIDKSFIDEIPHNQDDMEIAATIVAMGHILGFKVLAEGVETEEQLSFLRKTGCDAYQGYLKSRPIPANELEALLLAQK